MNKPKISILLAKPRGFCAGVDRAITVVEKALEKYGPPIYVRHEIVHNEHVVKTLEIKGAIFVEELTNIPKGKPVIFSAHGVPKNIPLEAKKLNLSFIDATCPLVSKVDSEAIRHYNKGRKVILIGHAGHPEVIGTMGQIPKESMLLIQNIEEIKHINLNKKQPLAYVTQTTLSVDETSEIIDELKNKFPDIIGPSKKDICYATTNRQEAIKVIAKRCDFLIILGSKSSSNAKRLVEVGIKEGCKNSFLVNNNNDIPWTKIDNIETLGLSSGASTPEVLIKNVIKEAKKRYYVNLEEITIAEEDIIFNLPRVI